MDMEIARRLKRVSEFLRGVFSTEVYPALRRRKITDRTLDHEVLNVVGGREYAANGIVGTFSEPRDSIYKAEGGRTPYDILFYGRIDGQPLMVFINNKYGKIGGATRNDITTYNNLLRLYLGISRQRLKGKIHIDVETIRRRIGGEEIASYGVFVVDKTGVESARFFLLEEVEGPFYVNPRNTMFQIPYDPPLRDIPRDYYEFTVELLNAVEEALQKVIKSTKAELLALNYIKDILHEVRGGEV